MSRRFIFENNTTVVPPSSATLVVSLDANNTSSIANFTSQTWTNLVSVSPALGTDGNFFRGTTASVETIDPALSAVTLLKLPMDTNFTDTGEQARTATLTGPPTITTSAPTPKIGAGQGRFNVLAAGSQQASYTSNDFKIRREDFTVDFWAYPFAYTSNYQVMFSLQDTAGNQGFTMFSDYSGNTGTLSVDVVGNGNFLVAQNALKLGVYQHIAITREVNSGNVDHWRLFIDGRLMSENFIAADFTIHDTVVLGNFITQSYNYRGYLDDVRFVRGQALYVTDFTPPTSATAILNAGRGFINNNATEYFQRATNNANTFYNGLHKANAKYSIATVIKTAPDGGQFLIFDNNAAGVYPKIQFFMNGSAQLQILAYDDAGTPILNFSSDTTLAVDRWYYVGVSIDTSTGTGFFYVDGNYAQVSSANTFNASYTSTPSGNNAANRPAIGAETDGNSPSNQDARIYEFKMWNGGLAKTDFDTLYTAIQTAYPNQVKAPRPYFINTTKYLGGKAAGASESLSVTATTITGLTLTYTVSAGSLPTGLSLNGATGAITGTLSAVGSDTLSSFTIRATDTRSAYQEMSFTYQVFSSTVPTAILDLDVTNTSSFTSGTTWTNVGSGGTSYDMLRSGNTAVTPLYIFKDLLLLNLNSNLTDSSSAVRTITNHGTVGYSTSIFKYGTASATLNSSAKYLSCTNTGEFTFETDDFTIEAWCYFAGTAGTGTGNQGIIGTLTSLTANEWHLFYDLQTPGLSMRDTFSVILPVQDSGGSSVPFLYSKKAFARTTFHHVAFTKRNDVYSLFVNGKLEDQRSGTVYSISGGNAPEVWMGQYPQAPGSFFYNGQLDDVRVIRGRCVYDDSADFTPPAAQLTNYTETGGNYWYLPTITSGAAYFDLKNSNMADIYSHAAGQNETTTFLWTFTSPAAWPTNAMLLDTTSSGNGRGLRVYIGSGQVVFERNTPSQEYSISDITLPTGKFCMLAISFDERGNGFMWLNGNYLQVSASNTFNAALSGDLYLSAIGPVRIGSDATATAYPTVFELYNMKSWKRALSKAELDTYFAAVGTNFPNVTPRPIWNTQSGFLPNGTTSAAYSTPLSVTGYFGGTIVYTLQSGTLPTGLSISGSNISGTPSGSGSSTFVIRATETPGTFLDRTFTIVVSATLTPSIELDVNNTSSYNSTNGSVQTWTNIGSYTGVGTFVRGNTSSVEASNDPYYLPQTTLLMNFTGNFTDVSPVPKTFTNHGATTTTTGQISANFTNFMALNGSSYVDTPMHPHFSFYSDDFTIECFIRPNVTTSNYRWLFGVHDAADGNTWALVLDPTDNIAFYGNGGNYYAGTAVTCNNSTWTHVAVVRSGTNLYIYKGGSRVATYTIAASALFYGTTAPFRYGVYPDLGNYFYTGGMDNVRIVRGKAVYTGATYTVPTTPVTAVDDSGSRSWIFDAGTDWFTSTLGTPYQNYGLAPTNTWNQPGASGTIEMWMRLDNVTAASPFLFATGPGTTGGPQFTVQLNAGGAIVVYAEDGASHTATVTTTDVTPTQGFGRIAISFDSTTNTIFVNWNKTYLQFSGAANTHTWDYSTFVKSISLLAPVIGTDTNRDSSLQNGMKLYRVRIWDRALSKAELDTQYDNVKATFPAYY